MPFTAAQIAEQLKGEVIGVTASARLTGFAPADCARAGDLTFAEKETYFAAAEQSQAAAILVSEAFAPSKKSSFAVRDARVAMARVLPLFFPPDQQTVRHSSKPRFIDASAQIKSHGGTSGRIALVGARVRLGARSVLMGATTLAATARLAMTGACSPMSSSMRGAQIGHRVSIHASTVIGSDGYSYVFDEGRQRKVLQNWQCDHPRTTWRSAPTRPSDRGALGSTVMRPGHQD